MTPAEILREVERVEKIRRDCDLDPKGAQVFFCVVRKAKPRNWDRVRLFPGVFGRCIGELEPGRFQVEARAGDLRRYLATLPVIAFGLEGGR